MSPSCRSAWAPSPRTPLAACVIAILGLPASAAFAGTVVVNNCYDSGTGSLRWAVGPAVAASGDSIDMTGLTAASPGCASSRITLSTGEIPVFMYDLTIQGPGVNNLEVSGNNHSRIFNHYGTGRLTVRNLALSSGYTSGSYPTGGCITSSGSVWLYKTRVHYCEVRATAGDGAGGGVFATKDVWIGYSTVAYNFATATSGLHGKGGAAAAGLGGNLTVKYSTIRNNYSAGSGGGLWAISKTTKILNSTLSANSANNAGGALYLIGPAAASVTISDSTISGNSGHYAGGMFVDTTSLTVSNSTIVFNTAAAVGGVFAANAPGLAVVGYGTPVAKLESTLVANNTWGSPPTELDLSATAVTISGDHNLVRTASAPLPPGTITGLCPLLGPLRFNGGSTRTHALLSRSPGIDQGSDSTALTVDQRGPSFARGSPTAALPDIGAYEVQQQDIVFNSEFEGCPTL